MKLDRKITTSRVVDKKLQSDVPNVYRMSMQLRLDVREKI